MVFEKLQSLVFPFWIHWPLSIIICLSLMLYSSQLCKRREVVLYGGIEVKEQLHLRFDEIIA